jgi:hypothetical protein
MLFTDISYAFKNATIAEWFLTYIRETDKNTYSLKDSVVTVYNVSEYEKTLFLTAASAFNAGCLCS